MDDFREYCKLRNSGWPVNDLRLVFAGKTPFYENLYRKFCRPPVLITA